ncbi:MAG: ComEC/Rec2 family competence protein [Rhodobiaceae bacterium]|nr:ComEC/Rec2 family competence protein [Rhodobiaceae bacterium]MCC0057509.1 ComEC/Rec2 family competence protein [Rhodobiaceae bacterium]
MTSATQGAWTAEDAPPTSQKRAPLVWLSSFMDRQSDRFFLWLPVLLAAGAAFYLGAESEPDAVIFACLFCILAFAAFLLRNRFGAFLLSVASAAVCAGVLLASFASARHADETLLSQRVGPVEIKATIAAIDRFASGRQRALLELEGAPEGLPSSVRVSWRGEGYYLAGERIAARVILLPPPDEAVPGGYNFRREAFFQGFGAVGYTLGAPDRLADPAPDRLSFKIERTRNRIADRIMAALPGNSGAIAAALLTGKRSAIDEDTTEALRVAGLGHLLAISGLHMVLVSGIVFFTLRLLLVLIPGIALRYPIKRIAAIGAIIAATAFLVVSGASIATVRAYIMLLIMLVAVIADRPAISLRNLALAAILIIALHPEAVAGASFQMSFAATTALIAAYEASSALRYRWFEGTARNWPGRALGLAGGFVIAILFTTLVAGLATSIFGAFHFNRTTPFSLLANMAAMPVVTLIVMPFGVFALALMPFGVDWPAWQAMGWGIDTVSRIATAVADLDGADLMVRSFPLATLVIITLGGLWLCLWRGRVRLAGLAAIVLGLAAAIWSTDRPAALIDRDGYLVAFEDAEGLQVAGTRRVGYVIDVWRRRLGFGDEAVHFSRCRQSVCIASSESLSIALVDTRQTRHWAHLCGRANFIVLSGWKSGTHYLPECAPKIIDRDDRDRLGAIAVYPDAGTFRLTGARPRSRERPWALHAVSGYRRANIGGTD